MAAVEALDLGDDDAGIGGHWNCRPSQGEEQLGSRRLITAWIAAFPLGFRPGGCRDEPPPGLTGGRDDGLSPIRRQALNTRHEQLDRARYARFAAIAAALAKTSPSSGVVGEGRGAAGSIHSTASTSSRRRGSPLVHRATNEAMTKCI